MDTGTQLLLFLVAIGLIVLIKGKDIIKEYSAFRNWRRDQQDNEPVQVASTSPVRQTAALIHAIDTRTLAGAGTALVNPPANVRVSLSYITAHNKRPYTFPIGWRTVYDGSAECVSAAFVGDVNHVALTGFTDSGKDSWAAQALLYLALTTPPQKLQLAIVDGKGGLSWLGWEHKQHVWLFAEQPADIRPAMDKLKRERERRQLVLKAAMCEKWEEYTGSDMPLLVAFVSELMLLQDATSKGELADWLNTELTSARAAGIRYIVSGQTFTRLDTRWRSQIGLYVAGYQPRQDADEPNTSFSTKELRELGTRADGVSMGIAPSELPVPPAGSGVFTCVQGRTVCTVRASYYPKEHRLWMLGQMPDRKIVPANPLFDALISGRPLLVDEDHATASEVHTTWHQDGIKALFVERPTTQSTSDDLRSRNESEVLFVELPLAADEVPYDEQRRIIEAAPTVRSRRQLTIKLYDTDGGIKSTWVKKVCDALGLLPPQGVAQWSAERPIR